MLSIVIPTYNSIETLNDAYQSVMNSGIPDVEIIFVDDGSTDNTINFLASIQTENPNVVVLLNQKNLGGGAARNRGAHYAKNSLIFILDSDDILVAESLGLAVEQLKFAKVDGIATSKSIFFKNCITQPCNQLLYSSGYTSFEDLTSHKPSPVTGNLLFTKRAFLEVGGYPEHHSFDTQGFGYRLLQNNKKILVANSPMYYQRIPSRPSYYMREARAGNINKNWYYIFIECLYRFTPRVRKLILDFPCGDPSMLAKGKHLFNLLADQSNNLDFYCIESKYLDERAAYDKFSKSGDFSLNVWCLAYEIRNRSYEAVFKRLENPDFSPKSLRILYPLIANIFGSKFSNDEINEFAYFFARDKGLLWKIGTLKQRIFNKLKFNRHV